MRYPFKWSLARRAVDIIVDPQGRARPRSRLRRSPLLGVVLAGTAGVALLTPGIPEALFASGRAAAHGSQVLVASARAAVESAADLLRGRSPGARTGAQLTKVKKAKRLAHSGPVARAKPRLRAPQALPAMLAPPATPLAFDDKPIALAFAPAPAFPGVPIEGPAGTCCSIPLVPPLTPGGGVVIGGGGGGGKPPPPPPPGVPEPQNWALMILGFGLIGTAWRRRRGITAAAQQA